MSEMDDKTLEQELRTLIAEIVEIEEDKVTLDASFVEDLGMDSMMALEILAAIEKKYKIQIPEQKLGQIQNLKQTLELAKEYLKKS